MTRKQTILMVVLCAIYALTLLPGGCNLLPSIVVGPPSPETTSPQRIVFVIDARQTMPWLKRLRDDTEELIEAQGTEEEPWDFAMFDRGMNDGDDPHPDYAPSVTFGENSSEPIPVVVGGAIGGEPRWVGRLTRDTKPEDVLQMAVSN